MTPRARDAFGRPLPHDADQPVEADPHALPPEQTLQVVAQLLDEGRAFRAHEVFEAIWKATAGEERELWRALAQLAVGITHAQRGNRRGSSALLRRAAANLAPWEGAHPHGIDVTAIRSWAVHAADKSLPPETLLATVPLRAGPFREGAPPASGGG
jgi:hypothetical protein